MERRDAQTALRLAQQWNREKLLPSSSLKVLEGRYSPDANREGGESFGSAVLYGLAGVLLGAAVFALLLLLIDNGIINDSQRVAPWLFIGWGIACAIAAFAIDSGLRKPNLADAFHVAALVAITASAFPRVLDLPLGLVGMTFAAYVLVYRRSRFMVPVLAVIAFNVALFPLLLFFLPDHGGSDEIGFTLWFIYALAQVATLVTVTRLRSWPWPTVSLASATLLVAGTFLGFYFEVLDDAIADFSGQVEIYLALLMAVILAVGFLVQQKGIVLASAFVIAIDAIVFAFAVGEIIGGLVAMLAVAALLIWQAGALRKYLKDE